MSGYKAREGGFQTSKVALVRLTLGHCLFEVFVWSLFTDGVCSLSHQTKARAACAQSVPFISPQENEAGQSEVLQVFRRIENISFCCRQVL